MFKSIHLLIVLLVVFYLLGCGQKAKMIHSWVDPSLKEFTAGDILVIEKKGLSWLP